MLWFHRIVVFVVSYRCLCELQFRGFIFPHIIKCDGGLCRFILSVGLKADEGVSQDRTLARTGEY